VRRIYGSLSLPPRVPGALCVPWGNRMRGVCSLALGLAAGLPLGASAQADRVAARTRGRPDAPVVMYEMSDFQCPYCRDFALETMPSLEREYMRSGKVRFTFINLPLTGVHRHAVAAAEVAMCAARQGRFWPVHDRLFQRQPQWAEQQDPSPYLLALAESAGVDHARLADCVTRRATRPAIEADAAAAGRSGARSTPTFYIEGWLIEGAAPLAVFREVLDSIYRSKTASAR
jgi:protein-disulfide isomerase